MADSQTFDNVSPTTWACVKTTSEKENGTVYAPPDASQGTATTSTVVGTVILGFDFDPGAQTVTYTVQQKPFVVPVSSIWSGIQATIDGCNGQ